MIFTPGKLYIKTETDTVLYYINGFKSGNLLSDGKILFYTGKTSYLDDLFNFPTIYHSFLLGNKLIHIFEFQTHKLKEIG